MFKEECGGGVARQLADRYKGLEGYYKEFCKRKNNNYEELKGNVCCFIAEDRKIIANIFSQKSNFDTDYQSMKKCLEIIKREAIANMLSIAIPYRIGCGIANGDWNIVYKIIEQVFNDYSVTLYRLEKIPNEILGYTLTDYTPVYEMPKE